MPVVVQAFSILLLASFVGYVVAIAVPYVRHRPSATGDQRTFQWHVLVPCRDEDAVIDGTLRTLRASFPRRTSG